MRAAELKPPLPDASDQTTSLTDKKLHTSQERPSIGLKMSENLEARNRNCEA
jgi:hypothetical protein